MKFNYGCIVAVALIAGTAWAQTAPSGDIPADFKPPIEAREKRSRLANTVFAGLTLVNVAGVAALNTYTASTLPTRAMSAIHWPSGLTMN